MELINESEETLGISNARFNDIEEIADSYSIQLLEEKSRLSGKLTLDYYFDTSDIINLIQGAWSYEKDLSFDMASFRRDRVKVSVYAFFFQKLFATPIKLLESHRIEFMHKIVDHNFSIKSSHHKENFNKYVYEVLYWLDLFENEDPTIITPDNIKDYIKDFTKNSIRLFQANYLLRQQIWPNRLAHLTKENIVNLETTEPELSTIDDLELFQIIQVAFDTVRPGFSNNNFYDVVAFYNLQKKLTNFVNGETDHLPVFYGSSTVIKKALKLIQEKDPNLFTYTIEPKGKRIPIVRDSIFFVLEAIFHPGDNTDNFFKDLETAKPLIRSLLDSERYRLVEKNKLFSQDIDSGLRKFEYQIQNIIETKFVQNVWIKEESYKDLVENLSQSFFWIEDDSELIEQKIQNILSDILVDAQKSLERSKELSSVVRSFREIHLDIRKVFKYSKITIDSNVYLEFALIKFGLNSDRLPKLESYLKHLFSEEEISESSPLIYHLISLLTVKISDKDKAEQFLEGLTVAWILEKYELIINLCSTFTSKDLNNRYETAFIYGNTLLKAKKSNLHRVQEVIDCVLNKQKPNYKIYIAVSYLYYRMWESCTNFNTKLPEMDLSEWNKSSDGAFYKKYLIEGSLYFCQEAISYLQNKIESQNYEPKHIQSYLHILNNYIFYATKSAEPEIYHDLSNKVDELKRYESYIYEWHGRFFDTLGWYFLRKSFFVKDLYLKKKYINLAESYNEDAISRPSTVRDKQMYKQLKEAILNVLEENLDSSSI